MMNIGNFDELFRQIRQASSIENFMHMTQTKLFYTVTRWTVLGNIQSTFFKIEKTQNGEKQFYISPAAVSRAIKPKALSRLFSACKKISQVRVFLLW